MLRVDLKSVRTVNTIQDFTSVQARLIKQAATTVSLKRTEH